MPDVVKSFLKMDNIQINHALTILGKNPYILEIETKNISGAPNQKIIWKKQIELHSESEFFLINSDDLKDSLRSLRFEENDQLRLTNPEIAMLCTLVPEDYEEAITLVPSLKDRFERGNVETIIEKLEQKMQAMA